jgi:hypothetical protein
MYKSTVFSADHESRLIRAEKTTPSGGLRCYDAPVRLYLPKMLTDASRPPSCYDEFETTFDSSGHVSSSK